VIKKGLLKFVGFFRRGKAKKVVDTIEDLAIKAMPYVDIAGELVVTLTPTKIDDIVFRQVKDKFPRLFDGSIKTRQELNLYALGVAGEMVEYYFKVDTGVARSVVEKAILKKTQSIQ
jgi:hypothetical protein